MFLELIGDYESMLRFDPFIGNGSPSVKIESLRLYIEYKSLPVGTTLCRPNGEIVNAIDKGQPVCVFPNPFLDAYITSACMLSRLGFVSG